MRHGSARYISPARFANAHAARREVSFAVTLWHGGGDVGVAYRSIYNLHVCRVSHCRRSRADKAERSGGNVCGISAGRTTRRARGSQTLAETAWFDVFRGKGKHYALTRHVLTLAALLQRHLPRYRGSAAASPRSARRALRRLFASVSTRYLAFSPSCLHHLKQTLLSMLGILQRHCCLWRLLTGMARVARRRLRLLWYNAGITCQHQHFFFSRTVLCWRCCGGVRETDWSGGLRRGHGVRHPTRPPMLLIQPSVLFGFGGGGKGSH